MSFIHSRPSRTTILSSAPLVLGFVLLICSAVSGVWLFWQLRAADEWVRHTLEVENELGQVQIEGLTAAVDIRTSVLAGRNGPDIDVVKIRNNYFAHIGVLEQLTADNPSQQARLESLRATSDRRFLMLAHAVADRRAGRIAEAAALIASPKTQWVVQRARRDMEEVRAEEIRLLKLRSQRANRIERLASGALGASLLLTLLLALVTVRERRARMEALWDAKRDLESALEAKRSFLANMSHEIRTPMNGVLGFTELLLADDLSSEQRKRAEMIDGSGRAMMRLLNDILDFSKIEAGQMRIVREPFDLAHAIEACVKLVSPAAARKGLALDVDISSELPKIIISDGLRLRQIVLNLLGNAMKFTEVGTIAVKASATGGKLVLEVKDTGIGIAPDRQKAIFEEFVQADNGIAARFGGTGLGLSITMRLVRLMDGMLELESEPGRGSLFRVTLPLEAGVIDSIAQRPAVEVAAPGRVDGARILLAEDHDVNQELFLSMLKQIGARADLARDGAEAVRMIELADSSDDPYRAVLMDVQMPTMDGLEATRRVRSSGIDGRRLPILALTANAYEADVAACFAAGCQAHLAKPIKLAELGRALQTWAISDGKTDEPIALSASLRERYARRKLETLQALDQLVRHAHFTDEDLGAIAGLLHKLAGTAAMFGEPELGNQARDLEEGIEQWAKPQRDARIRAGIEAIRKAA